MPPQKSPGPANFTLKPLVGYNDHDVNSLKKRAPQWSFGARLKGINDDKTPSAANYDIRKLTRFGKYPNVPSRMSKKIEDKKFDNGPGSNRYNPTDVTVYKAHGGGKFSIGIRTKTIDGQCSPGPVSDAVNLNVYKKSAPKYSMFGRNKELSDGKSPGPNQYSADESKLKTMKSNPVYSMRPKTDDLKSDRNPGPTAYDLINHNPFNSAPCYSLRRLHSEYANVLVLPNDNC